MKRWTLCVSHKGDRCWGLLVATPRLCARAGATCAGHGPMNVLSSCPLSKLDRPRPRCSHTSQLVFVVTVSCWLWFWFKGVQCSLAV